MVGPDRIRSRRAGRSLPSPHHGLPGLAAEGLEKVPRPLGALLLYEVVQHLERVRPAESATAPDHAELPRTLRAQVARRALITLLPEHLHARGSHAAVLTYHPFKASD